MKTQQNDPIILNELLAILEEEELIRLAYRLRRAGKEAASLTLEHELGLREIAKL